MLGAAIFGLSGLNVALDIHQFSLSRAMMMFVLLLSLATAAAQLHQGDWPQFGRTAAFNR